MYVYCKSFMSTWFLWMLVFMHACYPLQAPFQFSLASHWCHMHDTVLHAWSSIRWLASHTWMLFHFLNLAFTIFMHNHSLLLTLGITMHSHLQFLLVSRREVLTVLAWLCLARTTLHNYEREGTTFLLENAKFYPATTLQSFFKILRGSDFWPRKLHNVVPGPASLTTWNCSLWNLNTQ